MIRTALRWAARAAFCVAGALALYGLAAFACALSPVGGRIQLIAPDDPPVFVCASATHTDLVVPIRDSAADWPGVFADVADEAPDSAYIAIGWGDLGVYRDTARWSDLRPGAALSALAGVGPTTLHVISVNAPTFASDCVQIAIDRSGRQALARFILGTADNDGAGRPRLLNSPRAGEAFYAAKGRYSRHGAPVTPGPPKHSQLPECPSRAGLHSVSA